MTGTIIAIIGVTLGIITLGVAMAVVAGLKEEKNEAPVEVKNEELFAEIDKEAEERSKAVVEVDNETLFAEVDKNAKKEKEEKTLVK